MTPASKRLPHAGSAIPSLDGLRAVAVSLVFLAHSGLENFIPGGLGVTIFFVLSGFLITTLMRTEYDHSGAIRFRVFYLRRLLRLMPPLLIVVVATWLLSALAIIDGHFTLAGLSAAVFYFGNYFLIAHDFHGVPAGLGVIWSLAIEEHYYLVYPPLAALLLRIGSAAVSVTTLSLLCAAVLAWRYWLVFHGGTDAYLVMATDTRIDAILVGCFMALLFNPWLDRVPAVKPRNDWLAAALCIALLIGTLVYRDPVFRLTARFTLQSLAVAPLIYLAVARAKQRPYRWLGARPLVYLGTISYTIYLSHHVILLAVAKHWPQLHWAWVSIVAALLTLAVAGPMRRWVEGPCTRLRQRLHRPAPAAVRTPRLLPVRVP